MLKHLLHAIMSISNSALQIVVEQIAPKRKLQCLSKAFKGTWFLQLLWSIPIYMRGIYHPERFGGRVGELESL